MTKRKQKITCLVCNYNKKVDESCTVCRGTGVDDRKWYMLVGWSEACYHGYWKSTSDWDKVQKFITEGMELYGCADSQDGIHKLQHEFYDKGGWFYR